MMKVEHSLEVSVPDERPTLAPASSCPSLASSRERVCWMNLLTQDYMKPRRMPMLRFAHLRQLSEKQRLALMECKCLLSDTEEKVTELALKN